jgi:catecholate siderophore receptor
VTCPHRLKPRLLRSALAALLAGPGAALAQQPAPAPEAALPEVTVKGEAERADGPVEGYRATRSSTFTKTDTPLREVPASVTVVPAQVMKDQAMQGMGDVFRYVPGTLMHQGEGNRDQIVIRGNSTTADFYVDGVRDDAQVFRDLYNLERVEVLKGPAGMAFGRGGAGGVVNRVTKTPLFEDFYGAASVTAGSWNQLRGTADLGGKLGEAGAWRLNAMSESADSFRHGVSMERYAVNPTVTLLTGSRTALTFGFEHAWDYRTADRGFPSFNGAPFQADPGTFFGNADQSHLRNTVDSAYATLNHEFAEGWQLKNTLRATHYDKYYQNVYPGSAVAANGTLTLSAYNNANQRTNVFNQTDLTKRFSAGGLEHTLLVGSEVGTQNSSNLRNTGFFGGATSITVSAANPYAIATSFRQNGTDANNNVRASVAALYVQDQVALSKAWKAIVGLRYDRFKVDFDDRRTLTPAVDLSRTDTAFSPRGGLVWTPTAAQAYYASYSYAFLPSAEQLGLATGTASLEPETAKNYEVGARWDLLPRLTLSAALFRTDRDNVRVTDPANPGQFIKTGQLRSEGFELGLQGEVTKWWQVYGGLSNLDARVRKAFTSGTAPGATIAAGNKLPLTPEHTLSLWNRFDVGDGWGAGLGLICQSSSFAAVDNTVTLPAFTRADAAVYYSFRDRKTRLALNVENVTDRKYFPTVDGNNNISPGAPRNARLTLSTSF